MGDDAHENSRPIFELAGSMLAAVSSRLPAPPPACPPAAHSSPTHSRKTTRLSSDGGRGDETRDGLVVRVHAPPRLCVDLEAMVERGRDGRLVEVLIVRAPCKDVLPDRSFLHVLIMTLAPNVLSYDNYPLLHGRRRIVAIEVLHGLATAAVLAELLDVYARLTVEGADCKAASVGRAVAGTNLTP